MKREAYADLSTKASSKLLSFIETDFILEDYAILRFAVRLHTWELVDNFYVVNYVHL